MNTSEEKNIWQYFVLGITKNYANFNGRARRKEYWGIILFTLLTIVATSFLDEFAEQLGLEFSLLILLFVFFFCPVLAAGVRRMHDIGKTGASLLVYFIPLIGSIWLFVLLTTASTPGANRYGPNPKEPFFEDELDQLGLE